MPYLPAQTELCGFIVTMVPTVTNMAEAVISNKVRRRQFVRVRYWSKQCITSVQEEETQVDYEKRWSYQHIEMSQS